MVVPPTKKRMVPSRFQVRSKPFLTPNCMSQRDCTVPSARSIFLSLPPVAKATDRLSGDQNGKPWTLSVPGITRAVNEFNGRSHSWGLPSVMAEMTRLRPSGEIAICPKPVVRCPRVMLKRTAPDSSPVRREFLNAKKEATIATVAATANARHGMRASQAASRDSTTADVAAVVIVFPEELVGADNDSNAKPRSCAE